MNTVITSDRNQRDNLLKETNESGILTRPVWKLIPDLQMYKNCPKEDLSTARWFAERIVNLPSSARAHA